MKLKLIIVFLLLILIPLGLIAWLGVKTARQEQDRVQQRIQQVLIARLADLRERVSRLMEKQERDFQRLADQATGIVDVEPIRDLIRDNRMVRQMVVMSPDKKFIFPPPQASSDRERKALLRLTPIWKSGAAFHSSGAESGTSAPDSGWQS